MTGEELAIKLPVAEERLVKVRDRSPIEDINKFSRGDGQFNRGREFRYAHLTYCYKQIRRPVEFAHL